MYSLYKTKARQANKYGSGPLIFEHALAWVVNILLSVDKQGFSIEKQGMRKIKLFHFSTNFLVLSFIKS